MKILSDGGKCCIYRTIKKMNLKNQLQKKMYFQPKLLNTCETCDSTNNKSQFLKY